MDETVNAQSSYRQPDAYGQNRISENQFIGSTWTPSFYGYDGHGNVRFLTNASGTKRLMPTSTMHSACRSRARAQLPTFFNSMQAGLTRTSVYIAPERYLNQATGRFWSWRPSRGQKVLLVELELRTAT